MLGKFSVVAGLSLIGFVVGYAIGQEARKATPSNIETGMDGGVVTIRANVSGALSQGVNNFFDSL